MAGGSRSRTILRFEVKMEQGMWAREVAAALGDRESEWQGDISLSRKQEYAQGLDITQQLCEAQ